MYILDSTQAITVRLSNDGFYYLLSGEEPLDEENIKEAQSIAAKFPYGFEIRENWRTIKDSDLIEATFVPYIPESFDYDEYSDLTNAIQQQIKWLDSNHIRLWHLDKKTGKRTLKGDFEVYKNGFGHLCFQTGDYTKGRGCLFYMKYFHRRG